MAPRISLLRRDPVFKTVAGSSPDGHDLASQETLSRFENALTRRGITALMKFFIRSWLSGPKRERVVLEFDGTDDPAHGRQELSFYHGYYGQHMYHPLLVHDGQTGELIVPLLRPGNVHGSKKALGMLAWIVREIRRSWGADVMIEIRADAGFAIPKIYTWCERNRVTCTIGLVTNSSLTLFGDPLAATAKALFEKTGEKQRLFEEFGYKAGSWERFRRVIVKAEYQEKGSNTRFVVTNRYSRRHSNESWPWKHSPSIILPLVDRRAGRVRSYGVSNGDRIHNHPENHGKNAAMNSPFIPNREKADMEHSAFHRHAVRRTF